jgi:hypothetical protein
MSHEIKSNSAPSATTSQQTIEALNNSFNDISGRIIQIQKNMDQPQSPREIAEDRLILSKSYGRLSEMQAYLEMQRNVWWREHRQRFTSDTSAKREWGTTWEGEMHTKIKFKLKSLDKMISSLKSMLEVAQNELRNNY